MKAELNEAIQQIEMSQNKEMSGTIALPIGLISKILLFAPVIKILAKYAKIFTGDKGDKVMDKIIELMNELQGIKSDLDIKD